MKKEIKVLDYANQITTALKGGVLLTTKYNDKVDSMAIGYGMIGKIWDGEYFIVYVREGRYTRELLDQSKEFTVNIPHGEYDKKIIGYCGSRSGKDIDKLKDLNLTLVEGDTVSAPAIKELPLTLECEVKYQQLMDSNAIPEYIRNKEYPQGVPSSNTGCNQDYHIAYYGKIAKAYIIE